MSSTKWTIKTAMEIVKRTGGAIAEKGIRHKRPGIGVLGAIDFLCGNGYRWYKGGRVA